MGKTTAYRSVLHMRDLGYIAECVEHRQGSFVRKDLFGFADVCAYGFGDIILIQAYHKKEEKNHAQLVPQYNEKIRLWLSCGGKLEHHLWSFHVKKGRKYWEVERRSIVPV